MEIDNVTSPTDILAAADTLLNAPPKEPEAAPAAEPAAPPADVQAEGETEPVAAPAAQPEKAPEEAALTDPLAERQRQLDLKEAAFNERERLAREGVERLLRDPEQYKQARKELGIDDDQPKPSARPAASAPDPIENPDAWRYRRTLVYEQHAERTGADWTPAQIREGVERDLREARDAVYIDKLNAVEKRIAQREAQERETLAQTRSRMEQEAVDKAMAPHLAAHFPRGVTPEAREDIDAHLALARAKGGKVDVGAIVAKIAGRTKAVVGGYVQAKRNLAAATGATNSRGAQAVAPSNPIDNLPADVDSIKKIGELRATGRVK